MTPFTEWIKIDNYPTEFNVRKVHIANQDKFFISTADANKKAVSFEMTLNSDGKWNITKPAPEYILQIKELLINMLQKHCSLQPLSMFAFERPKSFEDMPGEALGTN